VATPVGFEPTPEKRKMSAETRVKLSAAGKRRWQTKKAQQLNSVKSDLNS
jgi:hypothetical protein